MTTLTGYGDTIVGERLVYVGRKRSGERLVMKSGTHRGLTATIYDAKCWIERPIRIKQQEADQTIQS